MKGRNTNRWQPHEGDAIQRHVTYEKSRHVANPTRAIQKGLAPERGHRTWATHGLVREEGPAPAGRDRTFGVWPAPAITASLASSVPASLASFPACHMRPAVPPSLAPSTAAPVSASSLQSPRTCHPLRPSPPAAGPSPTSSAEMPPCEGHVPCVHTCLSLGRSPLSPLLVTVTSSKI